MKGQVSQDSLFVAGAARFRDLVYFITRDRELTKENVKHTSLISFDEGEWAEVDNTNWQAVGICVCKKPTEKMIAVGEDGDILTFVNGKATEEIIEPRPIVLRGVGVVDGMAIVVGMNRQVYTRVDENRWVAMHAPAPALKQNSGFEAVAGSSSDEVYAVGWNGEIWEWDGSKWIDHPSPTNLILTGVCCTGDQVFVCGQYGTLVHGRHDAWNIIDLNEMKDDFWDICWFSETLYLATMTRLYTYTDKGLLPVVFEGDSPATCYRLTHAEGVLWSVGSNDVFSFDGSQWARVD